MDSNIRIQYNAAQFDGHHDQPHKTHQIQPSACYWCDIPIYN